MTMISWAAHNTAVALILAVVVALICRLGRLGPASRHTLWLVVLVKLVTPPLIEWPWALPLLGPRAVTLVVPPASPIEQVARGGAKTARGPGNYSSRDYIVSSEVITVTVPPIEHRAETSRAMVPQPLPVVAAEPPRSAAAPSTAEVTWTDMSIHVFGLVWLVGALIMAGTHFIRISQLRKRVKAGASPPRWLVRQVAEAATSLRLPPPEVRLVADVPSPLVWAFGRSRLLWPAALIESPSSPIWRGVIVHELAHLRRRDHWIGWLELVASCLWWWNPVFWYARHQLREQAELACDAWVVRILPEGRQHYAAALLAVCEFGSQTARPLPALGVHSGARHSFERRLKMILREHLPVRVSLRVVLAALLLAALAVPGWTLIARAQATGDDQLPDPRQLPVDLLQADPAAPQEQLADDRPNSVPIPDASPDAIADAPAPALPNAIADPPLTPEDHPPFDLPGVAAPSQLPQAVQPVPRFDPASAGRLDSFQEPHYDPYSADSQPNSSTPLPELARGQGHAHVVETSSFTLTRTTYKLAPPVAENLTRFLEQNLSWPHLLGIETKPSSEDGVFEDEPHILLVVTASPAAQDVIAKLIGLMLDSKPRGPQVNGFQGMEPMEATGSRFGSDSRAASPSPRLDNPRPSQ